MGPTGEAATAYSLLLSDLGELSIDAVFGVDSRLGTVFYANACAKAMFGGATGSQASTALEGKAMTDLVDARDVRDVLDVLCAEGSPGDGTPVVSLRIRRRGADGRTKLLESRWKTVYDEYGLPAYHAVLERLLDTVEGTEDGKGEANFPADILLDTALAAVADALELAEGGEGAALASKTVTVTVADHLVSTPAAAAAAAAPVAAASGAALSAASSTSGAKTRVLAVSSVEPVPTGPAKLLDQAEFSAAAALPPSGLAPLLDHCSDLIFHIDAVEGTILGVNGVCYGMLGFRKAEVLGRNYYDFMAMEHHAEVVARIQALAPGESDTLEFKRRHRGAKIIMVECIVTALPLTATAAAGTSGVVPARQCICVERDITWRWQQSGAEELRRRSRAAELRHRAARRQEEALTKLALSQCDYLFKLRPCFRSGCCGRVRSRSSAAGAAGSGGSTMAGSGSAVGFAGYDLESSVHSGNDSGNSDSSSNLTAMESGGGSGSANAVCGHVLITYASPAAAAMLGVAAADVVGMSDYGFIASGDIMAVHEARAAAFARARDNGGDASGPPHTYRRIAADGKTVWVEARYFGVVEEVAERDASNGASSNGGGGTTRLTSVLVIEKDVSEARHFTLGVNLAFKEALKEWNRPGAGEDDEPLDQELLGAGSGRSDAETHDYSEFRGLPPAPRRASSGAARAQTAQPLLQPPPVVPESEVLLETTLAATSASATLYSSSKAGNSSFEPASSALQKVSKGFSLCPEAAAVAAGAASASAGAAGAFAAGAFEKQRRGPPDSVLDEFSPSMALLLPPSLPPTEGATTTASGPGSRASSSRRRKKGRRRGRSSTTAVSTGSPGITGVGGDLEGIDAGADSDLGTSVRSQSTAPFNVSSAPFGRQRMGRLPYARRRYLLRQLGLRTDDVNAPMDCAVPELRYPLVVAAAQNNAYRLALLLALGADADIAPPDVGFGALHMAVMSNSHECLALLGAFGANLDILAEVDDEIATPLAIACKEGYSELVTALLELGADVNRADHDGNTPLHHAVELDHAPIAKQLLAQGADVMAANHEGFTPATLADKLGASECAHAVRSVARNISDDAAEALLHGMGGVSPSASASVCGKAGAVGAIAGSKAAVRA